MLKGKVGLLAKGELLMLFILVAWYVRKFLFTCLYIAIGLVMQKSLIWLGAKVMKGYLVSWESRSIISHIFTKCDQVHNRKVGLFI